ncbi:hypothetical protein [Ornithinimicrobium kibberense]|uniref:hypothetical protein n=1 Tax=Ornithinimicrobium kibberense TaxID=282060 RepID=UPI0036206013
MPRQLRRAGRRPHGGRHQHRTFVLQPISAARPGLRVAWRRTPSTSARMRSSRAGGRTRWLPSPRHLLPQRAAPWP